MRIIYCKTCSPKKVLACNVVEKVVSHNVHNDQGETTATHTDFGSIDVEESVDDDLDYLQREYVSQFI